MRPPRTVFKRNDRFGEYLLVDYLGGGGSGEVWLAANSRQEYWAIKLFKATPNKRSVLYRRFVNEVERVRELTEVKGIVQWSTPIFRIIRRVARPTWSCRRQWD